VVICPYCHGNKQENCYNCFGKGTDPVNPQLPCAICHGTRFVPCRYCKAMGTLPCPNCQGRGGTPCPNCQGKGLLTQEVELNMSAAIQFAITKGASLPSGLLRGLDRLGMANLARGHGDIELIESDMNDAAASKNRIVLRARIPYADIKLRLKEKTFMVACFGKNGLLSGLPAFLDESLRPWREQLARAAAGDAQIEKALGARAMRETLALKLHGKGQLIELRRLYPIGLTPKVAQEILDNMEKALRRQTQRTRIFVAVASIVISTGVFAGLFLTPLHAAMRQSLTPKAALLIDALLPALAVGLSGFAFAHAAKWALKRRYPKIDVNLNQSIGKIGYGTLAGIIIIYALIFALGKYVLKTIGL
jgi:hypothetical protein